MTRNSEAGHISGRVTKVHTRRGHTRRASKNEPQYKIRSGKTDRLAAHKGSTLRTIN